MATALDVGLFDYFGIIFPFILSWLITYSALQFTKILGENKSIHAMIALAASAMLLFAPKALLVIKFITPWFVLLFVFVTLMLMMFKLFGADDKDIKGVLMGGDYGSKAVPYWIISISMIVLIVALGSVYGDGLQDVTGDADEPGFEASAWAAFFHPKVVGLMFISLVGTFTILLLAGDVQPIKKR